MALKVGAYNLKVGGWIVLVCSSEFLKVELQGRIQAFVREGARIARKARGKIRPRPQNGRKRTQTAAVRLVFNVFDCQVHGKSKVGG